VGVDSIRDSVKFRFCGCGLTPRRLLLISMALVWLCYGA